MLGGSEPALSGAKGTVTLPTDGGFGGVGGGGLVRPGMTGPGMFAPVIG